MKTKKNKQKFIVLGFALSLLIGGGVGAAITHFVEQKPEVVEQGGLADPVISTKGMSLRLLNSVNNADGSVTKTYSYTMNPENADIASATAEVNYEDHGAGGGNNRKRVYASSVPVPESVMTATVDKEAKTVAITNKAAFHIRIIVTITLTATDGSTASGTITFDYVKKLLGMTGIGQACGGQGFASSMNPLTSFAVDQMITPNYSIYTKDKAYTFAVKDVSTYCEFNFDNSVYQTKLEKYKTQLETFFKQKISSGGSVTVDELWNVSSDNDYHAALKNLSALTPSATDNSISVGVNAIYYCVQNENIKLEMNSNDSTVYFGIKYDFSAYTVGLNSITLEATTGEF